MYFGIDDIIHNTINGIPVAEIIESVERILEKQFNEDLN